MYFTVDLIDVGITRVKMPSCVSFAATFVLSQAVITVTIRLTGVAKSVGTFTWWAVGSAGSVTILNT